MLVVVLPFVNAHVSTSEALSRSRLIVAVAVIGDFVPEVSVSVPVAQVHVPTRDVASSERSVGLPGFVSQFGCALATPTVIKVASPTRETVFNRFMILAPPRSMGARHAEIVSATARPQADRA